VTLSQIQYGTAKWNGYNSKISKTHVQTYIYISVPYWKVKNSTADIRRF